MRKLLIFPHKSPNNYPHIHKYACGNKENVLWKKRGKAVYKLLENSFAKIGKFILTYFPFVIPFCFGIYPDTNLPI